MDPTDTTEWHAHEDGQVVGRAEAWKRHDGRLFVSIDSWRDTTFDQLADTMLADLPRPLHTMVDASDAALRAQWERRGFTAGRSEWVYRVPTDPRVTGLDSSALPPPG